MAPQDPHSDDDCTDISEDPELNAIQLQLHAIDKRNDTRLLVALAVGLAPVALLTRLHVEGLWVNTIEVLFVVALLGGTIYSAIRQKQKLAARHGLVCARCGYLPWPSTILSAATTQRCRKCGSRLGAALD
jgi:DNA-directed RNA polymerase subunit RPC12/RpoP